ncbi:MAG: alpha/beta hydrolase [Betaproteobacteria bacterium]
MLRAGIAVAVALALVCLLGGCSVFTLVNAFVPRSTYVAHNDLAYGSNPRQKVDVYEPRDAAVPPGGYPVVVFFYGGSWTRGDRSDYRFIGEALAARGFLAVLADYRLYPEVRYPDFLEDCAAAVAWSRREAPQFRGNSARLYVMGHSAGGYNAAMLALDPRWLRAEGLAPADLKGWIGLAGPYDFLPSDLPDVQKVFHHPDYPPGAQPIEHVSSDAPRTFLGAAARDNVVSPTRSTQQMADRLRAAGVPVTLEFYARVNHGTLAGAFAWPLRGLAPVLDDVTAFIRADSRP